MGLLEEWYQIIYENFLKPPKFDNLASLPDYSEPSFLDMMVRCESTHFLLSCLLGWLVFSLIWTIFSSSHFKCSDRYIFRISLVSGLLASVTLHMFIDTFTTLAWLKMIRYQCNKCKEYFIGGAEDKYCPLCNGTLIFREIVYHD